MLFGMGSFGIGAIFTPSLQAGHAYLGRICRTISALAGMNFLSAGRPHSEFLAIPIFLSHQFFRCEDHMGQGFLQAASARAEHLQVCQQ